MRARSLFAVVALVAALVLAFAPVHRASADLPYLTAVGVLANPGDAVELTGLTGQSSCSFYETGTPGTTDVYGSPDSSLTTTNITPIAVTDYASPPNVQAQPFTPTAGDAYILAPTSFRQVRIVADSTWPTGNAATVFIGCSSSIARLPGGSGGGTTYTFAQPIYTPSSNQIGFNYAYNGAFSATQAFTDTGSPAPCATALPNPGWLFDSTSGGAAYEYWTDPSGPFHIGVASSSCGLTDAITVASTGAINFPQLSAGTLCILSSIVTTTGCSAGEVVVAGQNIMVTPSSSPADGVIVATTAQPYFTTIELPQPQFSPGTLVGVADAGDGNSKLVQSAVSPCPTASCVVSVTGNAPVSCGGVAYVTCTAATPSPSAGTGIGVSGSWPYTISDTAPTPYPTPLATGSPPVSLTASTTGGVTTYTAELGVVPASLGGFGASASGYSNGQCPAYSTTLGYFVGSTCGGGTYSAGTNISITSNVISVLPDPKFTGNTQVEGANGLILAVSNTTLSSCSQADIVGLCMSQVSDSGGETPGLTFGAYDSNASGSYMSCRETLLDTTTTATLYVPCAQQFNSTVTMNALTANTGACLNASKSIASCSAGTASCSLSVNACTATATVVAHSTCTASMDSTTAAGSYYAPIVTEPGAGTTLSIAVSAVAATGTAVMDYRC